MGTCLDSATEKLLQENKSPARRLGSIDNRGSHFYIALYWAQELASQKEDLELANAFKRLSSSLKENEDLINEELIAAQSISQDIDGYYLPNEKLAEKAMRPSTIFNKMIDTF